MSLARLVPLFILVLAGACGGKVDPDSTSSSSSGSTGTSGGTMPPGRSAPGDPPSTGTASPYDDCVSESGGGGGSGGTSGSWSCSMTEQFRCSSGHRSITCKCSGTGTRGQGACSCGGTSFRIDCTSSCSISAADYARCGLPGPSGSSGFGGSSSTSS